MRKLILIAHTSLDGFVAGPKGDLDGFDASEENLQFVGDLTKEADAAVFGRVSYQLLDSYWPAAKDRPAATPGEIIYSNWYNHAQKVVISKTMQEGRNNTTLISTNVPNEMIKVKEKPGKNLLIFGSPSVAQLLMKADLIDSYWIFINPTIFGEGIPLFANSQHKIKLRLVTTKQFSNGELALHYVVDKT